MPRQIDYRNGIIIDRVVELIDEIGMTTTELCRIQSCERKTAYGLKNGTVTPSFTLIKEVSRRSGRSLDWIFYGEE